MADREKSPKRVTTGKVLLSYAYLWKPKADPDRPDEKPKYQCQIRIDKKDKQTVAAIKRAIKAVEAEMITKVFGGKTPKKAIKNTLKDGDVEKDEEEYEGIYYMNVSSNRRPPMVDRHLEPITDEEEIYSGVYARVCLNFYYYDRKDGKGITAGLESIQKVANGERLGGGGGNVEDDFGDDFDDFEDDYGHDSDDDEDYDI